MDPRITIVTLGVDDVEKSRRFYEGLGWKAASVSDEQIVLFNLRGAALALFSEKMLAQDAYVPEAVKGFRGMTLAQNVSDKAEVKKVLDKAAFAGATILKEAQDVFWGGYSGYFQDPDGHVWEIAWNPHWPLQADGTLKLPE